MNCPEDPRSTRSQCPEGQLRDEHLRNLGLMLAGFAHELNTPLGVIASLCDGLQRCQQKLRDVVDKPELDADDHENLRKILYHMQSGQPVLNTGIERMQALVRELRLAARPDGAEPPLDVSIVDVLEGDLLLLNHATKHGIDVKCCFEARPVVKGRPGLLGQVFLNLLRNAMQAVGDQGTIRLTVGEHQGRAVVEVADSGPGLPAEALVRVFEEGFTTKCPETGTGIGLFMSRKVLEKHGGDIVAANRPEGGAVFTVTLPLA